MFSDPVRKRAGYLYGSDFFSYGVMAEKQISQIHLKGKTNFNWALHKITAEIGKLR